MRKINRRDFMKTMGVAAAAMSLTACGGNTVPGSTAVSAASGASGASASAGTSSGESKVVVGLAGDPQNIGPFQGMSLGRIGCLYTMYEFLVTTEGGEMQGVMMKEYEKIDDLTYNCTIYDSIYDQAGNQVKAADVAYSYNMGMTSGNLPKLGSIDSVTALDDYTVQFKFNTLAIGDLGALWMECPVVTQKAYEASADQMATDPVSTTAYKCTEFTSGAKMVFQNTGSYWQKDETAVRATSMHNVDTIEFDIIVDASQMTNALKTRAIDVTNFLSDADVPDFQNAEGYEVSQIPDNTEYFLLFNCDADKGKFADNPDLRQALAYAVDKQQLIDGALSGNGNPAKTWGNKNYSDYVAKWDSESYYDYDLDKAKQLFASGNGAGLTVNLMYQTGDTLTKIATIIQAQLQLLGVTVNLCEYDSQLLNQYKYQPEQWDLMLDQGGSTSYLVNVWKLGWDRTGYTHGGAENFVKDDQLQSLLETAMDETQHNDDSMDAFHQYLKEQCYGIGLCQQLNNITHTDKITNIVVDARGQVTPGACEYSF